MGDSTREPQKTVISVVTPTFRRQVEVSELLENLSKQTLLPTELVLVDGAPDGENETENFVKPVIGSFPFQIRYERYGGGTAVQRNRGIDLAKGDLIALVDDDVRLAPDFLATMADVFAADKDREVGAVVGYRTNRHFEPDAAARWRWYRRLGLLKTFEPGRYDFECGYPINNNLQAPFSGTREVDFMTTACAVWRKEVFASGLRFHPFFRDYGILEDAHFALTARRNWKLLQSGDAHCEELHSPNGRVNRRMIGYKCVVNYYFVFSEIAGPLSFSKRFRFWRYQAFEIGRILASAVVRRRAADLQDFMGRVHGWFAVLTGRAYK